MNADLHADLQSDPGHSDDFLSREIPPHLRAKGGFTVKEYETRVWDMARHVLHPTALYVTGVVAGGLRLLEHPIVDEPGRGGIVEGALFLGAFLGAWACFYSTLLRDAGLPSRTVTFLVPLAWIAAAFLWFGMGEPAALSRSDFAVGALFLLGPAVPAWVLTQISWRRQKQMHAHLLAPEERP